jgi:single-strand DNA-binding protein
MNQCILTGNLGGDPEIRYSAEGNPVASFNLAFSSGKDKTSWLKVVCFNRLAEVVETYLHKGAKIALVGTLDQNKWEGTDGIVRTSYQLIASNIEFIKTDGRGFENKQKGNGNQQDGPPF